MKKKLSILAVVAIALSLFSPVTQATESEAKKKPSISADSGIVMDVQSGTILYEKNMDKKQYPASIDRKSVV